MAQYGTQRLPKYMSYFEDVLKYNGARGPSDEVWLVGDKLSVADLAVYHYLAAAEQHYG